MDIIYLLIGLGSSILFLSVLFNTFSGENKDDNNSNFIDSFFAGAIFNSTFWGYILGGDLLGAWFGKLFGGNKVDQNNDPFCSNNTNNNCYDDSDDYNNGYIDDGEDDTDNNDDDYDFFSQDDYDDYFNDDSSWDDDYD